MSDTRAGKGAARVPRQRQRGRSTPPATPPAATPAEAPTEGRQVTGWVGWIFFAAVLLTVAGSFQVIAGLTAVFNSGYFLVGQGQLLVDVDFTAWGGLHIAVGVLMAGTAYGLMRGHAWARIVAISLAVVSAIVNLGFLAAYPVWAVLVIALDVVLIYAIAVHGEEMKAPGM